HVVDVLDGPLLAGGDDEALFIHLQRHPALDLARRRRLYLEQRQGGRSFFLAPCLYVDERAHALVLAEIAARVLVARRAILDRLDLVEADERGALALLGVQAMGLDRTADGAGLAAELVDEDLRLDVTALETRLDEIDLRLDGRQIVLRAALQDEAGA